MPLDLSDILVVGVSSRALFDLEKENEIFDNEGISGYRKYQQQHEDELLLPGTAFHLVQSLLHLNTDSKKRIVEGNDKVKAIFTGLETKDFRI